MRARPCVFIGYPPHQKAYKVLDLLTHTIHISRDIVFHEQNFPFHNNNPTSDHTPFHDFFLPHITSPSPGTLDDEPDIFQNFAPIVDINHPPLPTESSNDSSAIPTDPTISSPQIRQSTRIHKTPSYLSDYLCSTISSTNPKCNIVEYSSLPQQHQALLAHNSQISEPTSFLEAASDHNWVTAMEHELQALKANDTWDVVPLPVNKKPIGCKWVYKLKLKSDGSIERFKARLVAKGFTQKYGVDFDETFSPVIKMTTIRCLLALAAQKTWDLHQLDVNNAFLHGDLHEEVYMKMPEGVPNPGGYVCKLKKSIYGLKQASRQWFSKLVQELQTQGFIQSKNDYSLFIKREGDQLTLAAVYVDDIILIGNHTPTILALKHHLHTTFSIKDLGNLHFFLGMEICKTHAGIVLTQQKFTKELLQFSGLDLSRRTTTPLPSSFKLHPNIGTPYSDPAFYRSLVGKLNFLTHSRPDLTFAVQTLSQFMQNPTILHMKALHHTLRYVAGSIGQGILLKAGERLSLVGYSDSDWATCPTTRRSITGYLVLFGGSPVSWKRKKQSTISKSSSEAEYRAMVAVASEITWLVRLLDEIGVSNLQPVTIYCDNQSAISIGKNPVHHE